MATVAGFRDSGCNDLNFVDYVKCLCNDLLESLAIIFS